MICFKDRTFCASPDCKGECGRQWTKELHEQAIKWWGSDEAPVAFSLFCGKGNSGESLIDCIKALHKRIEKDV